MDAWGWEHLQPWLDMRRELPVGPLLCVINGATRGRRWSPAAARAGLRRVPPRQECGAGSRPTSFGTLTPSRWPAKVSR
jgi:hypothetical protein